MSTITAPERTTTAIEEVIEEPFIIEGWDDEPKCENRHPDHGCTVNAEFVVTQRCAGSSVLWCRNTKVLYDKYMYPAKCNGCGKEMIGCWKVRAL